MTPMQQDAYLLHPFTALQEHEQQGPHIITSGSGVRLQDNAGRDYIDAMAGLWCVNVGYGRTEIADAMRDQSSELAYYHSFMSLANEPSIQLAEQLGRMAPGSLNHVFFSNSGSEANDTNVKIVWYYNNLRGRPKKKKIISRTGAYHGVTLASASLSGLPNLHAGFDVPLDARFIHVSQPHVYWNKPAEINEQQYSESLASELEQRILAEGPDTIAAFIAEPVMGAAGVIPPPKGYFEAIVPVLRRYDLLLIVDEVICGFGRLGAMFGSDLYDLKPDLMTLAKGLTSGYAPMSASLVSDDIYDVLRSGTPEMGPFAHGFTYTAHPLSATVALKNLEIIGSEDLVTNANSVGEYFQKALRVRFEQHELVGNIRGRGLIAGIELVRDKQTKTAFDPEEKITRKLYRHMLTQGLIARPILNTIAFSPPLILTTEDADSIVERFATALDQLTSEL